jgi:hypothetical protein
MRKTGNVLFSGSFSSGKTTEFESFDGHGDGTKVPEFARIILANGMYGKTIAEVHRNGNYANFQRRVVAFHRHYERLGHEAGGWTHDAGTVSAWAYSQDLQEDVRKAVSTAIERHLMECPPRKVLVFEPLRIKDDGVRHTSKELQATVHKRVIDLCEGLQLDWALIPACGSDLRKKVIKEELKK